MQERVEKFLMEYENKQKELAKKEREKFLIKAGFYCKEYSPNNQYSAEYCQAETTETDIKYYKITVIDVTDEEYEKIKSCICKEEKAKRKKPIEDSQKYYKLYKVLPNIVLWTMIILSIFLGIVISALEENGFFFFVYPLAGTVLGFIYFIIFKIAISPIILQTEYLKVLVDKTEEE